MVGAVALLPASVVNNGGQVGEVSVEVDVLGIVSTNVPSIIVMMLTDSQVKHKPQYINSYCICATKA